MIDAADQTPPDPQVVCESRNMLDLAKVFVMEDMIEHSKETRNEQVKIMNMAKDMVRAAKEKEVMQKLDHLEKLLQLEKECNKLMTVELERLKVKALTPHRSTAGVQTEVLTSRDRRELLETESQLTQVKEDLLIALEQLENLPDSEQRFYKHLYGLSEVGTGSDPGVSWRCELEEQWDTFKRAHTTEDQEMAHLQQTLYNQQEEMKMKVANLEEKLLQQMKDAELHRRENDEKVRMKVSDLKTHLRREISDKGQHLKEELSGAEKDLKKELSKMLEQLKQREEDLKMKALHKANQRFRQELQQRRDVLEEEALESMKKLLSELEEHSKNSNKSLAEES